MNFTFFLASLFYLSSKHGSMFPICLCLHTHSPLLSQSPFLRLFCKLLSHFMYIFVTFISLSPFFTSCLLFFFLLLLSPTFSQSISAPISFLSSPFCPLFSTLLLSSSISPSLSLPFALSHFLEASLTFLPLHSLFTSLSLSVSLSFIKFILLSPTFPRLLSSCISLSFFL